MISCDTSGIVNEPLTSVPSLAVPTQDSIKRISKMVISLGKTKMSASYRTRLASRGGHHSYFDFLWPSSTSPSASLTDEMETTSPLSPDTEMVVSSRFIHSSPHFVMFLFFQCQFAVEGGRAMAEKGRWRKRQVLVWLIARLLLF